MGSAQTPPSRSHSGRGCASLDRFCIGTGSTSTATLAIVITTTSGASPSSPSSFSSYLLCSPSLSFLLSFSPSLHRVNCHCPSLDGGEERASFIGIQPTTLLLFARAVKGRRLCVVSERLHTRASRQGGPGRVWLVGRGRGRGKVLVVVVDVYTEVRASSGGGGVAVAAAVGRHTAMVSAV